MESVGMKRALDSMGRVVIPADIRRRLDIAVNDELDFYIEEDRIILKKHRSSCIFCGGEEELSEFMGRNVCRSCLDKLTRK